MPVKYHGIKMTKSQDVPLKSHESKGKNRDVNR